MHEEKSLTGKSFTFVRRCGTIMGVFVAYDGDKGITIKCMNEQKNRICFNMKYAHKYPLGVRPEIALKDLRDRVKSGFLDVRGHEKAVRYTPSNAPMSVCASI